MGLPSLPIPLQPSIMYILSPRMMVKKIIPFLLSQRTINQWIKLNAHPAITCGYTQAHLLSVFPCDWWMPPPSMSVQSQKKNDSTLVSALKPKICDYIGTPYIFTTRCLGAASQGGKGVRGGGVCTVVLWCGRLHIALDSCTQQFGSTSLLLWGPKIGPIGFPKLLWRRNAMFYDRRRQRRDGNNGWARSFQWRIHI